MLETYQATGNLSKAAKAGGLKRRELVARRKEDPELSVEMQDAFEAYLDGIEELLRGLLTGEHRGNPLPAFAILKAHRPDKWHDKAQATAVQVNVQTFAPPPGMVEALLAESIAIATPETKALLAPADKPQSDPA